MPEGGLEVMKMNRCSWCGGLVVATRHGLCCPWCDRVVEREQKSLGKWVEAEEDEGGC